MTTRRFLRLVPLVALVVLILGPSSGARFRSPATAGGPAPSPSPSSIHPSGADGALIQEIARDTVTGPPGSERDTAVEPFVATDPNRPRVAVAVFQVGRFPDGGAAAIGFAASGDGGRTWTSGTMPGLTEATGGRFLRVSDPSVAFGPDGTVYASSIVIRGPGREEGIAVNRSNHGGRSWNPPVLVQRDPGRSGDDFPRVAVDTAQGSVYRGRVYMTYSRHDRTVLRWSDDRAATWSPLRSVSPGRGFVPNVVVGPAGVLTVVYIVQRPKERSRLVSRTSGDGGASFGPEVEIGVMRPHVSAGLRAGGVEETAVDPVTGGLFVVWEDAVHRGDSLNDVVVSRSLDEGTTWTAPAKVNPGRSGSGTDHLEPVVAARGGHVHVVYLTRAVADGRPSRLVQLRSISSSDGGVTFQDERPIGPAADLGFAAVVRPDRTRFLGDYLGLALSAQSLLIVWCRSFPPAGPAGYHVTVWAAKVQSSG